MFLRSCACVSLFLVLSAGAGPAAFAADDTESAVLADCTAADLPASTVDSCLERARVLDETNPSPQLESLEAQLQERESGHRGASGRPRSLQAQDNPAPSTTIEGAVQTSDVGSMPEPRANAADPDQTSSASDGPPANAVPYERGDDERGSVEAQADRPPPGINDDQPPVADPPDDETAQDRSDDAPEDPR
jgi:hypothetical protein